MGRAGVDGPIAIEDGFGRWDDLRILHSATWVCEDSLFLFFNRKSDVPDYIILSVVPLNGDWTTRRASRPIEMLRQEVPYEGIEFPMKPPKKEAELTVRNYATHTFSMTTIAPT